MCVGVRLSYYSCCGDLNLSHHKGVSSLWGLKRMSTTWCKFFSFKASSMFLVRFNEGLSLESFRKRQYQVMQCDSEWIDKLVQEMKINCCFALWRNICVCHMCRFEAFIISQNSVGVIRPVHFHGKNKIKWALLIFWRSATFIFILAAFSLLSFNPVLAPTYGSMLSVWKQKKLF